MDKRPQRVAGIHQNPKEDIGSNLFDISHRDFFQDMSSKTKERKAKINIGDFIKIRYLQMTVQTKG